MLTISTGGNYILIFDKYESILRKFMVMLIDWRLAIQLTRIFFECIILKHMCVSWNLDLHEKFRTRR